MKVCSAIPSTALMRGFGESASWPHYTGQQAAIDDIGANRLQDRRIARFHITRKVEMMVRQRVRRDVARANVAGARAGNGMGAQLAASGAWQWGVPHGLRIYARLVRFTDICNKNKK